MSSVLLSEIVKEYLVTRSARCSAATVKNEGLVLSRFVATVAGGREIQVRNLTPEHVENWFSALRVEHRDRSNVLRPPVQASTLNYYRARIKSLVEYLARRGLTKHDLLAFVEPMRVARKVRQQPSPDTLLAMLARANEPRDRALLAVAANTGLRASEIARLRVGDLDLDTLTLRVWVSKSSMEDDMPVTADLAAEMRRWLLAYAKSIQRPLIPVDYLLPACTGPRYFWRNGEDGVKVRDHRPSTYVPHRPTTKLHRIAQRALRSVGLETRHEGIHSIRRAVARAYYDSLKGNGHEAAIREVMVLLHHSNQSTTEAYLGVTAERAARDKSLRGRSFLTPSHVADVMPMPGHAV